MRRLKNVFSRSTLVRFREWSLARAQYFGILGAAIILISWTVTNTLSNRLDSARSALNHASADDDQRRQLEYVRRGYREVRATLDRIDLMVSESNPTSLFSTFPVWLENNATRKQEYALLKSAESSFFANEDLEEIVLETKRLSDASQLPSDLMLKAQKSLNRAEDLITAYRAATTTWDAAKQQSIEEIKKGNLDTANFRTATSQLTKTLFPLSERCLQERNDLLQVHGEIVQYFSEREERLKRAHDWSEKLSWLLYVVGTCIVTYGKWAEIRQKQQAQTATG